MSSPIIPILLAGGAGTRLWPVSRDALPKQFLPLIGDKSTYQETLLRVRDAMFAPPIVITGPNFHFFARRQAEEIGVDATIVIEPMRRDSGPAIAAATMVASRRDPKAVVLALFVPLIISKIGIGADIYDFAHGKFAFLYGLLSVLLAGAAGWAASAIFKRV